jgi:hypothetical protein
MTYQEQSKQLTLQVCQLSAQLSEEKKTAASLASKNTRDKQAAMLEVRQLRIQLSIVEDLLKAAKANRVELEAENKALTERIESLMKLGSRGIGRRPRRLLITRKVAF